MIIAPNDVSDPHGDVVGDNRKIVDRAVVTPQDDEVVEIPALETDPAMYRIVPGDLLVSHPKPDRGRCPILDPLLDLAAGEAVETTIVAEPGPCGLRPSALGIQLLLGAKAAVRLAFRQEPFGIRLVPRSIFTLKKRAFVPGDAEPGETVQNDPGMLLGAPLPISVLDPEDVSSTAVARVEPIEERGARSPDVEVAGGRGCKANAGSRHGIKVGERSGRDSNPR